MGQIACSEQIILGCNSDCQILCGLVFLISQGCRCPLLVTQNSSAFFVISLHYSLSQKLKEHVAFFCISEHVFQCICLENSQNLCRFSGCMVHDLFAAGHGCFSFHPSSFSATLITCDFNCFVQHPCMNQAWFLQFGHYKPHPYCGATWSHFL